jgi:cytochrome c biogenesis protein CcdA
VLGSTTVSIEQTVASVTAFGLGLATPLTVMTVLVGVGLDIGSSAMTRHANQVYRLSGVLILLVGAWQFLTSAGFLQQ